jgi:hypothetical protein
LSKVPFDAGIGSKWTSQAPDWSDHTSHKDNGDGTCHGSGELHAAARSDDGEEKWPAIIEKAYADAYGGQGGDPFAKRDNLREAMES